MTIEFSSVEVAIEAIKAGRMVILVDDESRENEGDLVVAAACATPEIISFMVHHGCGLVCLPMATEIADRLQLPMMASQNGSRYKTAFTVSIEAQHGVTTGISAQDRAHTIQVAIDPNTTPSDLVSPGHMFPLRACEEGVLVRTGHTEGAVDLVKLAGLTPAAVICEILNHDGSTSRREQLAAFSQLHGIPMLTIQQLVEYRVKHENLLTLMAKSRLPMEELGDFEMMVFTSPLDASEHVALVKAPIYPNQVPLVRIHCECLTGDVFGSSRCDCGAQLSESLAQIAASGGVFIYLRQEGRGIGLANKLKAYALQETGFDTVEANLALGLPADNRNYGVAYQILKYLGIDAVRLLTNNPLKVEALQQYGTVVAERLPLLIEPNLENYRYLRTKQEKFGHFLSVGEQ